MEWTFLIINQKKNYSKKYYANSEPDSSFADFLRISSILTDMHNVVGSVLYNNGDFQDKLVLCEEFTIN